MISENKDSDGGFQINSPISEDHPPSLNEGNEDLNCGESPSPPFNIYERASRIDQRDVEEAVGDETDGQGTKLKSRSFFIVKVVKEEETEEGLENASIYIERLKSAKESCNGESKRLPMANSAEQPDIISRSENHSYCWDAPRLRSLPYPTCKYLRSVSSSCLLWLLYT
ncbi:hypothetical protein NL676_008597 [Syzygium grande]|nr:hypothetical protein NL676_008597 [Syzygium grande]